MKSGFFLWLLIFAISSGFCGASDTAVGSGGVLSDISKNDEMNLRREIIDAVKAAWEKSKYDVLESVAQEYVGTRAKTFSGKWRLAIYADALEDQMRVDWPVEWYVQKDGVACKCKAVDPGRYAEADRRWDALREKFDTWIKLYPNSPHARVAMSDYLIHRAWFYRGSGYSTTVPDEAWPLVGKYIEEARVYLMESREISIKSPLWFERMIFISSVQSWPQASVQKLLRDLFDYGQSYAPAYQEAAEMLLPKWGGSYEAVDQFARNAIANTEPDEGFAIYTRIYWSLAAKSKRNIFQETRADWPTINHGFDAMLKKYPDAKNLNGKAMFACMAGDREVFQETVSKLGERLYLAAWAFPYKNCSSLQ